MSRRTIAVLVLVLTILALAVLIFKAHPCRDPDPPDHPVPVDYDDSNTPIAAPAAK